jgi:Asp-tRNA(Asn)/Glu-tRNA(Gln) amidotransferase A subunit family amidase
MLARIDAVEPRLHAYYTVSRDRALAVPLEWFQRSERFTVPWNYNGWPTLSLPCGATTQGLPLSLQLVGHPLSEGTLLRAGHAFESATEWHRRHPKV